MTALALVALTALMSRPFELPEPKPPAPALVKEDGEGPRYFRLPPPLVEPSMEYGVGVEVRPAPLATGGPLAFSVHGQAGLSRQLDRGSPLRAHLLAGYSYAAFSEHLFTVGPGLSVEVVKGDLLQAVHVGLLSSWVLGTSSGQHVQGFRVGVVASWLTLTAEVHWLHLFGATDWGALGVSVGVGSLGGFR